MGCYITGILVAAFMVCGLYGVHETSTGNYLFAQDKLDSKTADELRVLARDFKSSDQVEAILQLGIRPGELEKTVPLLAKLSLVQFEIVKNSAESSLKFIGADAAEHLRELIDEDTTTNYRICCSAMRAIGPGSKIFLPELKRLLKDDNPGLRKCALYALQGMGEDGKAAMPEIVICVLDTDLNNQCSACRILEKFGTDAIDAEQSLLKLQKEGGPSTRGWAAVCLGAIGPTSTNADVAELLAQQLLPGKNGRTVSTIEQQRVLTGLAYLGPEATKVSDIVRKRMNGKNAFIRGYAAFALWRITGEPDESLEALQNLLDDPHYRDEGLYVVARMGPDGLEIADDVARLLRSHEPGTRELAVVALGNMGPEAKSFAAEIRERLDDTDAMVRMSARHALSDMGFEGNDRKNGDPANGDSKNENKPEKTESEIAGK